MYHIRSAIRRRMIGYARRHYLACYDRGDARNAVAWLKLAVGLAEAQDREARARGRRG